MGVDYDFLNRTLFAKETSKMKKDYVKLKNFYTAKETTNTVVKRLPNINILWLGLQPCFFIE